MVKWSFLGCLYFEKTRKKTSSQISYSYLTSSSNLKVSIVVIVVVIIIVIVIIIIVVVVVVHHYHHNHNCHHNVVGIVNTTAKVFAILFSFTAGWLYKHQSYVEPTRQGIRWVNSLYPGSWSLFHAYRKFIRIPRPKVSVVNFYITSFSKSLIIQQVNSKKNTHRQVFRYLLKYSLFA